jgi:hypothetical protein
LRGYSPNVHVAVPPKGVEVVIIRSRPLPPQKELDFEIDLSQFDDEEVLRKTSGGVDVNYIDFDDYFWTPTSEQDDGTPCP